MKIMIDATGFMVNTRLTLFLRSTYGSEFKGFS